MRMQHNISPPAPGRGGNRKGKRKREGTPPPTSATDHAQSSHAGSVKNEAGLEEDDLRGMAADDQATSIGASPPPSTQLPTSHSHPDQPMNGYIPGSGDSSDEEFLPPTLMPHFNANTGLVMGRSPILAKYLVTKAKHRYVVEEHELLVDELELIQGEEKRLRAAKDQVLNQVLFQEIGCVLLLYPSCIKLTFCMKPTRRSSYCRCTIAYQRRSAGGEPRRPALKATVLVVLLQHYQQAQNHDCDSMTCISLVISK